VTQRGTSIAKSGGINQICIADRSISASEANQRFPELLSILPGVSRGANDEAKIERVRDLIARIGGAASLITPAGAGRTVRGPPAQRRQRGSCAFDPARIFPSFQHAGFGGRTVMAAADLMVDHKLQYRDALIVTAAAEAGCTLLLSNDQPHSKLKALLDGSA